MADQKVRLDPPATESVSSRPLKTGASFTLVVPKKRLVYRHWDKEKYLPGEEAELLMEGEGIGNEKYAFVIERAESESGPWTEVVSLQAQAKDDKARAKFRFPRIEPKGRLSKAEWKRAAAKPGDRLGLHVEGEGLEGAFLSIHVERKDEGGEWNWEIYTRWQGEIEQGKYDGIFNVPPAREKPSQWKEARVVALDRPDGPPRENARVWFSARTENLDGAQLQFILERADAEGNWAEIGSAVSTVARGQARNSIEVPPLPPAKSGSGGPDRVETAEEDSANIEE